MFHGVYGLMRWWTASFICAARFALSVGHVCSCAGLSFLQGAFKNQEKAMNELSKDLVKETSVFDNKKESLESEIKDRDGVLASIRELEVRRFGSLRTEA